MACFARYLSMLLLTFATLAAACAGCQRAEAADAGPSAADLTPSDNATSPREFPRGFNAQPERAGASAEERDVAPRRLDTARLLDHPAGIEQRLRMTVRYLASDELEGRGVGTDGIERAA